MSSSTVDPAGEPIPTSSVLMASAKHIATRCRAENVAFIKCKKEDPNPEKCLDKGKQVTRCVLSLREPICSGNGEASRYSDNGSKVDLPLRGFSLPKRGLKDLHHRCSKEMDDYAGCMYYHTNEFELCRKEQKEFEKTCPLK